MSDDLYIVLVCEIYNLVVNSFESLKTKIQTKFNCAQLEFKKKKLVSSQNNDEIESIWSFQCFTCCKQMH